MSAGRKDNELLSVTDFLTHDQKEAVSWVAVARWICQTESHVLAAPKLQPAFRA